ncbi:squamosa promoter-binding-like protein 17 [Phalaenopsis equestris]|uniref:squamosa promoter-binding-like protein 17 n=1 Tax=Phalaenopsis equestris TaxID=78828 RepID=UPI0009E60F60|nr:squamosa promoter-binding-like protein 17 [Phalaenopsis equestris]
MEKSSSSAANGYGDSLNGLKFGKKIYFEDVGGSGSSSKSMAAVGKKGKGVAAVGGGQQKAPRCQVEGCNLDLTGAKAYYCRHKVCGMHSKSPRVIVAGLEQRFCQQCSRFQLLPEFDQGKRSCRRRLAGHNERRRKPHPGPLTSRCGRLSFHEDDSRYRIFLKDFSYPSSHGASRDIWPMMRNDQALNNQWHGSYNTRIGAVTNHYPTFLSAFEQASSDCLTGVSDSSCALSLLSNQPWGSNIMASAPPRNHPPRNHEAPLISAGTGIRGGSMAQINMASSNMSCPWMFRDHSSWSSSLDMGLRQLSDAGNGHFSSELELALQDNRQCDDEIGHREVFDHDHSAMHWSL